ncbi:MAG: DegT/DnrJ/EryC1/StrS family aminotransferase [Armatimonadetes bacterium]|nr:DegT/DnrJ/EryC1/StrS family aminotransferase [Armatimonadota bacterium]
MNVPLVDLKAQHTELKAELDAAVLEVISGGMYTPSKHVAAFEEEVAAFCGAKHAIACNSGTDALKIGLQAMGIKHGDEVITTPFTFVATIEAIIQNYATPVFVDIDPRTFNLDVSRLEAAITPKTKAIIPIHLFGQIAEMEQIMDMANAHGIQVLEDAAQAIGSTRNGHACGYWGKAAALSFFPTKNLGAAGDAGMVLTDDDEIAYRSRSLRVHGMAKEPYLYEDIGHTSRLDEIQGAILRVKLRKLLAWNELRRRNASIYDDLLAGSAAQIPFVASETTCHPYHQYTVRHPDRDGLMAHLKEKSVGCAIYYPVSLHVQPVYAFLGHGEGSFPETERACREVLSLPIQAHLSEEQVRYAAGIVAAFE